jgi:hypothetical protein
MPSRNRIPSASEDTHFIHTDADPERKDRVAAAGRDERVDMNSSQEGGTRSSRQVRSSGHPHKVVPAAAAYEGSVTSRVFDDPTKQGISSKSSQAELPGQQKVVNARPDAQAGLNHSSRNKEGHD